MAEIARSSILHELKLTQSDGRRCTADVAVILAHGDAPSAIVRLDGGHYDLDELRRVVTMAGAAGVMAQVALTPPTTAATAAPPKAKAKRR